MTTPEPHAIPTLDQLPDVLTVEEAMAVLRISRNAAYENIRTGVLPAIRLGRRLLVPKAALRRLLQVDRPEAG